MTFCPRLDSTSSGIGVAQLDSLFIHCQGQTGLILRLRALSSSSHRASALRTVWEACHEYAYNRRARKGIRVERGSRRNRPFTRVPWVRPASITPGSAASAAQQHVYLGVGMRILRSTYALEYRDIIDMLPRSDTPHRWWPVKIHRPLVGPNISHPLLLGASPPLSHRQVWISQKDAACNYNIYSLVR